VFTGIENPSPGVEKLIAQYRPDETEVTSSLALDLWFVEETLGKIAFVADAGRRSRVAKMLLRIIPRADPVIEKFVRLRIVDPSLVRPSIVEGSSLLLLLIGLLRVGLTHPQFCKEFTPVLRGLSVVSPLATSQLLPAIEGCVAAVADREMLVDFMVATRNFVAFEPSIMQAISPSVIDRFLALDYGREEAIQFASLVPERASGSPMMTACVGEALGARYSLHTELLIRMVVDGVDPGNFVVPARPRDPMSIRLAHVLITAKPERKDELADFILAAVRGVRPLKVIVDTQMYRDAVALLRERCPEKASAFQAQLGG